MIFLIRMLLFFVSRGNASWLRQPVNVCEVFDNASFEGNLVERAEMDSTDLIVEYTKLLNHYGGPTSAVVKAFRKRHLMDSQFQGRAATLDRLWLLKETRKG